MKKGVVMEQHRRYTIVMTSEGTFYKAKHIQSSQPGDEVSFEPLPEREGFKKFSFDMLKPNVRFIAMVAALLIAILPLYSWYDSNQAYAYVNIEMNPSIEMKVNNKMKVIEMMPLNDEASLIVEKVTDWKNKAVEKVTVTVIEKGKELGLINEEQGVMIGGSRDRIESENEVLYTIDQYLQNASFAGMKIATFDVPKDIREKAQEAKMSMNEMLAQSYQLSQAEQVANQTEQMTEDEQEAFQSFYNKAQVEAPDASQQEQDDTGDKKQTPSKNIEEPEEPQSKGDEQPTNQSNNPVNPAGKEKGWAKQDKEKEDPKPSVQDLPADLEQARKEILKELPPGLQKKVQNYDNWNELPPGIQKQIVKLYKQYQDNREEAKEKIHDYREKREEIRDEWKEERKERQEERREKIKEHIEEKREQWQERRDD